MHLDSQSSIYLYIIPYHADLSCLRIRTCIQASTLASPLIYNFPSQYRYISVYAHVINLRFYLVSIHAEYTTINSSGISYDTLY